MRLSLSHRFVLCLSDLFGCLWFGFLLFLPSLSPCPLSLTSLHLVARPFSQLDTMQLLVAYLEAHPELFVAEYNNAPLPYMRTALHMAFA